MIIPCAALWPSDDPGDRLLHWSFIAGKLGASSDLQRPFLIGIRGAREGDAQTHRPIHRPTYEDTFVLLARSTVETFPGATYAYQRDSKASPDVDGDKRGDVGSIRCGRYVLSDPGLVDPPIFNVTMPDFSARIPCHRDTDHNGVISEEEVLRSEDAREGVQTDVTGHYATAVLFHVGFTDGRSSIACQTADKKALELMRLRARPSGLIDYVLINAWTLVPFAEEARRFRAERMGENLA